MSEDKGTVEIIEPVVEEKVEPQIDLSELSSVEKDMAEKSGIVKKEVVDEKKEDKPPVESAETKDGSNQTFEDTEKNEAKLIGNYSKNEQALYWKWKHDKKERQTAQAERDLALVREKALTKELEKIRNDSTLSVEKLKRINQVLTGPAEEITVEALQAILTEPAKKTEDKDKPLTVKDFEGLQEKQRKEQEERQREETFVNSRIKDAEDFGKTKFGDKYDDIMTQAQEVIEGKVELPAIIDRESLSDKLVKAIKDREIDIEKVSDLVVGIAKLNPKFGKPKEESSVKKETKENIDRILNNESKQKTSASVGGGNGRRVVSYEDMTVEDAARLTPKQWRDLPPAVRERLLAE